MFVGRKSEQEAFVKWLEDGDRRAMVVVGNSGMGKTALLAKFAELCEARKRTYVQAFKLNRNENAAAFFERVLQETHRLLRRKMLPTGPRDRELVKGLLKAVPKLGKLLALLVADEKRPGWRRFLDYAAGVDKALGPDGRLVLLIDPDGKMEAGQADEWLTVAGDLARSVRVVIAQRPDDVIAGDSESRRRFEFVPKKGRLGELDRGAVEEWYEAEIKDGRLRECGGKWSAAARRNLMDAVWERFGGYPIAHEAAVRLLASGDEVEEPAKVAETWPREIEELMEMLFESLARQGEERLRAGLMLAVFGVAVPREAWAKACGKSVEWLLGALADAKFGLFFEANGEGEYSPFHALFGERLDLALAEIPEKTQEYAEAAWGVLEPALDVEKMERERPRDFELMAATVVAGRFEGETMLVEAVDRVFKLKRRVGMLDAAERDLLDVLARCAGNQVIVAATLGNLGTIMQIRGNLDEAERLHRRAIELDEETGRLEGLAIEYGNIGLIAQTRGNFDEAECWHRKSIQVSEKLGELEGMSRGYGNLGVIAQMRGHLEEAERWHDRALNIDVELGHLEGIAIQYAGLALIEQKRSNLDEAEKLHRKSLEINEQLGRMEGIAVVYGNLGLISRTRGDFDEAECLHRKAFEIEKRLGRLEGMAIQCGNLGIAAEERGKKEEARALWTEALTLFGQIGMGHMAEEVQGWLDELEDD